MRFIFGELTHTWASLCTVVAFSLLFVTLILLVFRKGSKNLYDQLAQLPLEDDSPTSKTSPNIMDRTV